MPGPCNPRFRRYGVSVSVRRMVCSLSTLNKRLDYDRVSADEAEEQFHDAAVTSLGATTTS